MYSASLWSHLIAEGAAIALVVQQLYCVVLALSSSLIKRFRCLGICANPSQKGAGLLSDHLLSLIA